MNASPSRKSDRHSSLKRKLVYVAAAVVGLMVASYFVMGSSALFKGVILPRVSRALGAQVTVTSASIRPFSQMTLRHFALRTTGTEPLLQAEEVRVRYGVFDLLAGRLSLNELKIVSPIVQIVEAPDGTSNLDPLLKKVSEPRERPSPTPAKPRKVDLKNLSLENGVLRWVKHLNGGGSEVTELSGVNLTLDRLANGQAGKLSAAAVFKMTRSTNDVLEIAAAGHGAFKLGGDLTPRSLQLNATQTVMRAEGSPRELAGVRGILTGEVTPTQIKEISERFMRGEKVLGTVKVAGPLDLAKKEGRLTLEMSSLDRQVLNLAGAPFGLDFGKTRLDAATEVSLTQGGSVVEVHTQCKATQFSLTKAGRATPPLDLQLACHLRANRTDKTALVEAFTLTGTQDGRSILRGGITRPMAVAWGNAGSTAGDAALELAVTGMDLADWSPFLGKTFSGGRLTFNVKLASQQGGKQLTVGATSRVDELDAKLGATALTQGTLAIKLDGTMWDFKKINLSDYRLDLRRQAQPALAVSGSAFYDGAAFQLQSRVEAVMARLVGSGPTSPIKAGLEIGGTYTKKVCDVRQFRIALAPTSRAPKNELNATGRLDRSTPGMTKGGITAKAETLDLTTLYDAFAEAGSAGSGAKPKPSAPSAPTEPKAVSFPLQLAVAADLKHVYLREIKLENCEVKAKVDGGRLTVDPCRLLLNGAPVQAGADLNLGVKGYAYVLSLQIDKAPLEPIANTFSPENRGKYQGLILADAKIKGAGLTGASLRKSLSGQAALTFTNAILRLIGPKTKVLITPIATLLRIPEITKSPLNWVVARAELGGGNITLSRFAMQSEAFEAETRGGIPIADVLTNSPLDLPVQFALRRTLASASSLLPPNTPPEAEYAVLPHFVTVKGTLGKPKTDLKPVALGGLLLKSGMGTAEKLGGKVGGKAGELLQGASGFLTGQRPASTNQTSTNPPPKFNPLDLFKKK